MSAAPGGAKALEKKSRTPSAGPMEDAASPRWHVSVLIPARDEEDLLPRCLKSVLEAREKVLRVATCDIVVAVDCSVDGTHRIAERMLQGTGTVVGCAAGAVGLARAAAAIVALKHQRSSLSRTWFANTDADCWVPPSWLLQQLELAKDGTEAIAGIVDVDSFEEHDNGVPRRFRSSYILNDDGTHPHVHGANLGVRADAYLRAGGWGTLCTAEDHDLWNRLAASGANRRSCSRVVVVTSGRRIGRAPSGFAAALAAHNELAV